MIVRSNLCCWQHNNSVMASTNKVSGLLLGSIHFLVTRTDLLRNILENSNTPKNLIETV